MAWASSMGAGQKPTKPGLATFLGDAKVDNGHALGRRTWPTQNHLKTGVYTTKKKNTCLVKFWNPKRF